MRLGIVTDVHLCPAGTPPDGCHNPYAYDRAENHLEAALEAHRRDRIELLAVLGDLSNSGDRVSLSRAVEIIQGATIPAHVVAGNHDRDVDPDLLFNLILAASLRPATPEGDIVDGIRIAGLQLDADCDGGWSAHEPDVTTWGDYPTILLSHIPVLPRGNAIRAAGLKYVGGLASGDAFVQALLSRSAPTVVVHGHLHLRDASATGPVLQIGCASLIEPPYERAIVEAAIDAHRFTVKTMHRSVAPVPEVRLPVLSPSETTWIFESGRWSEITDRTNP